MGGSNFLLNDGCPTEDEAALEFYRHCLLNNQNNTLCVTDKLPSGALLTVPQWTNICSAICHGQKGDKFQICPKEGKVDSVLPGVLSRPSSSTSNKQPAADQLKKSSSSQREESPTSQNQTSSSRSNQNTPRRGRKPSASFEEDTTDACIVEDKVDYFGSDITERRVNKDVDCARWCGVIRPCRIWVLRKSD